MIVLYDTPQSRIQFFPITLTRPISHLKMGIGNIAENWAIQTKLPVESLSTSLLSGPCSFADYYWCVDATVLPNPALIAAITSLRPGEMLEDDQGIIAWCQNSVPTFGQLPIWIEKSASINRQSRLHHLLDIIQHNSDFLKQSYQLVTHGRESQVLSSSNIIIGESLFAEEGVIMEGCIVNSKEGPVYIGKNALIMEGTCIRGPVSIGEGAVVKMGSKLYAGTNIGAFCTVGGEVKNTIFQGFANKAHDGYMGDSYIGQWCNLGAGTSNSNIKNTAGLIEIWDTPSASWQKKSQKCGFFMGDFSRTAINTSIPSGATIGVCTSIHNGFPAYKNIPSFIWGPGQPYQLAAAFIHIQQWMHLKGRHLSQQEKLLLTDVWNHSAN